MFLCRLHIQSSSFHSFPASKRTSCVPLAKNTWPRDPPRHATPVARGLFTGTSSGAFSCQPRKTTTTSGRVRRAARDGPSSSAGAERRSPSPADRARIGGRGPVLGSKERKKNREALQISLKACASLERHQNRRICFSLEDWNDATLLVLKAAMTFYDPQPSCLTHWSKLHEIFDIHLSIFLFVGRPGATNLP